MNLIEDIRSVSDQKHLQAANMARLLAPAEADAAEGRTSPANEFFEEFKRARNIPG